MKCLYHIKDLDGMCSAVIVKHFYPECELIGMDYGEDVPPEVYDNDDILFMVDFSLEPFERMNTLNLHSNLIWIDHHKTAIDEYKQFLNQFDYDEPCYCFTTIKGERSTEKAACELTWEYFSNKPIPEAIKLLGRYDVWDFSDERTLPFQCGIRSWINNVNLLGILFALNVFKYNPKFVDETVELGKAILRYNDFEDELYCNLYAFETEFEGFKCIAVNRGCINSNTLKSVWDTEKHDIMIGFVRCKGKWTVSLRTTPEKEIDVGHLAKKHDGGGHNCASGFSCQKLPFKI